MPQMPTVAATMSEFTVLTMQWICGHGNRIATGDGKRLHGLVAEFPRKHTYGNTGTASPCAAEP
jgi:hypothetical protein